MSFHDNDSCAAGANDILCQRSLNLLSRVFSETFPQENVQIILLTLHFQKVDGCEENCFNQRF